MYSLHRISVGKFLPSPIQSVVPLDGIPGPGDQGTGVLDPGPRSFFYFILFFYGSGTVTRVVVYYKSKERAIESI
jgi:hypothetical protein